MKDAEVIKVLTGLLNRILEEEFRTTILAEWSERMERCMEHDGYYFEKEQDAEPVSHSNSDGI